MEMDKKEKRAPLAPQKMNRLKQTPHKPIWLKPPAFNSRDSEHRERNHE